MKEGESSGKFVKLTVSVNRKQVEDLSLMALRHGLSRQDELAQIIMDRRYLEDQIAAGCKVLLEKPDGKMSELHFNNQGPRLSERER